MTEKKLDSDRQAVLDAERAVNEQYLYEIEQSLAKQPKHINQVAIAQSQRWTESSLPRPRIDHNATAAIIGRVALHKGHPYSDDLGQTFYVASWRVERDEFETVNWAAPVAGLYFEGHSSEYPIASSIGDRLSDLSPNLSHT